MDKTIRTRKGKELNVDNLSPGELKQIRRTRRMLAQEFVRSEEDDFVFRVCDHKADSSVEVKVDKIDARKWNFQGLYETAKHELVVLRSLRYKIPSEREPWHYIYARKAEIVDGRIVEGGHFAEFEVQFNPQHDGVAVTHRWVDNSMQRNGISSIVLDKIEQTTGAAGLRRVLVNEVVIAGLRDQDVVMEMLLERGYSKVLQTDRIHMLKKVDSRPEDNDLRKFHRFPTDNTKKRHYSEPIIGLQ